MILFGHLENVYFFYHSLGSNTCLISIFLGWKMKILCYPSTLKYNTHIRFLNFFLSKGKLACILSKGNDCVCWRHCLFSVTLLGFTELDLDGHYWLAEPTGCKDDLSPKHILPMVPGLLRLCRAFWISEWNCLSKRLTLTDCMLIKMPWQSLKPGSTLGSSPTWRASQPQLVTFSCFQRQETSHSVLPPN